jgi:hypothetical protein
MEYDILRNRLTIQWLIQQFRQQFTFRNGPDATCAAFQPRVVVRIVFFCSFLVHLTRIDGSLVSGNMLTGRVPYLNRSMTNLLHTCLIQAPLDTNCLDCVNISKGCTCEPCFTTTVATRTTTNSTVSTRTTGSSSTESSTSTVAQAQTPTSNSTSTAAQAQTPTSNSTSTAAQAQTPTSNSTSTAAQAQTPTSKTDDALIGGIVGGIVGFLFLVGAVIAAVIIIGRRRRATTETEYGVVPQKQLSEPNAYGSQLTSKDVTAANYSELKSSEI